MIMTVCSVNFAFAQNVDIDYVGSTLDVDWTDSSITTYGSMGATNPTWFFTESITSNGDTLHSDTILYIGPFTATSWNTSGFTEHVS